MLQHHSNQLLRIITLRRTSQSTEHFDFIVSYIFIEMIFGSNLVEYGIALLRCSMLITSEGLDGLPYRYLRPSGCQWKRAVHRDFVKIQYVACIRELPAAHLFSPFSCFSSRGSTILSSPHKTKSGDPASGSTGRSISTRFTSRDCAKASRRPRSDDSRSHIHHYQENTCSDSTPLDGRFSRNMENTVSRIPDVLE